MSPSSASERMLLGQTKHQCLFCLFFPFFFCFVFVAFVLNRLNLQNTCLNRTDLDFQGANLFFLICSMCRLRTQSVPARQRTIITDTRSSSCWLLHEVSHTLAGTGGEREWEREGE